MEENKTTLVDELEDLQLRVEALASAATRISLELLRIQTEFYQKYEEKQGGKNDSRI